MGPELGSAFMQLDELQLPYSSCTSDCCSCWSDRRHYGL